MRKLDYVMLVDDYYPTNLLHEMLIEDINFINKVLIQNDPEDALEYLKTCMQTGVEWPSIIFLDINMPKMNGWEFLTSYEQLYKPENDSTIVVVLTTSINDLDRKKALASDLVDEYMQKPLDETGLRELVSKYFDDL